MAGTFAPSLTVVREDDGVAWFYYSNGEGLDLKMKGAWDDATPWASGSYDMKFRLHNQKSICLELINVEGNSRTNIQIHGGNIPDHSRGCLVVPKSFIQKIYDDMEAHGQSTTPEIRAPMKVAVSGNFDVHLEISAPVSVTEGEEIAVTVSLVGPGSTNGVSKDIYVKLASAGGTAIAGVDYTDPKYTPDQKLLENDAGWILIPAGQTSVVVRYKTFNDDDDTGTEAPSETGVVKMVRYQIVNDYKGEHLYFDKAQTLLDGGRLHSDALALISGPENSATFTILNKTPIVNKTVQASGGPEGYHSIEQFAPGQSLNISFSPLTIPDRMILSDSSGNTLLDTGFIGNGIVYTTVFLIPSGGDGKISIDILTNNPGTAWSFRISTVEQSSLLSTSVAIPTELVDTPSSATTGAPASLLVDDALMQEGNDEFETAPGFSVQLNDLSIVGKTIEWAIVFNGANAANTADFAQDAEFSGTFEVPAGSVVGDLVFQAEVPLALRDAIAESRETFLVVLRDAQTHQPLTDGAGQPISAEFGIVDEFSIREAMGGTSANDHLTGSDLLDVIYGDLGDDVLAGLGGGDFLDGGVGHDQIDAGAGDDTITGGFGNDTIDGGDGFDTVIVTRAAGEVEIVYNSDGSVTLIDKSAISLGTDRLLGVEQVQFSDSLVQLAAVGTSVIRLTNNADAVSYATRAAGVSVLSLGGADTITGSRFADRLNGGDGDDKLAGLDGDDLLFGLAGADILQGLNGDDQLNGGDGADKLYGGLGKDTLTGAAGDDNLQGADGDDSLKGGDGIDVLSGGAGIDRLYGEAGDDKLDGGLDDDLMAGGGGKDKLYGGAGADRLYGEADDDTILGGDGADLVDGGDGKDFVLGDAGDDTLYGKAGDDTLNGGAGVDRLLGGDGVDILIGGADNDIFVFDSYSSPLPFPVLRDTIKDFAHGDRIDLSLIDVDPATQVNEAFTFIGTSQFNGAGQVRYVVSGANTIVQVNVGGDYATELEFTLAGYKAGLAAADFIL